MPISKSQFEQLGIQVYYLTPVPGYTGGWYGLQNGIAKKMGTATGEYLKNLGVPIITRSAREGVPADTSGGGTITFNTLEGELHQVRVRQETQAEEQRVRDLNAAIASGDSARVRQLAPGYDLSNGTFFLKDLSQVTQQVKELPQVVQQTIDKMYDAGYILNPNVQINEKSIDEFLAIASKEIDPYYQTQLKLISDELKKGLGYSARQLLENEAEIEIKYGRSLRDIGESAAETGFALSGRRQLEEKELAEETQRTLEQGRNQLGFQTGRAVGKFAQQYAGMPGFQAPGGTLGQIPRVLPGQETFQRPSGESGYYELSPEIYSSLIGEQEFGRRGALETRARELEQYQNLGKSQIRTINL